MKQIHKFIFVLMTVCFLAVPGMAKSGLDPVHMIPAGFSALAEQVKPGVVNIQTVKTVQGGGRVYKHFFGQPFGRNQDPFNDFLAPFFNQQPQQRKEQSLGSGFIISDDGYIVTNNHVIRDADKIKVILHDNSEYDASVVGTDPMTDLALIKIEASGLMPLKFGSSSQALVGSWVVAIGSPFGLEQTVTAGIVSAKGRIIGSGPYDDFIQTDASINPGNSGGPLLNLDGEVIGINTAIISSGQGIGFAIPSDLATGIIDQLTEQKSVSRGWMGVAIQNITKEMAEYYKIKEAKGVFVAKVYSGEPADDAGIKAGDVIVKINDKDIKNSRDLTLTVAQSSAGEKIKVILLREGEKKTIKVKLGKRPDQTPDSAHPGSDFDLFGMQLKQMTPDIANRLGYPESLTGLVVTGIKPDSQADSSPIRQGDVIQEVNRKKVATLDQYQAYINEIKSSTIVQLLVRKGNSHIVIVTFRKP